MRLAALLMLLTLAGCASAGPYVRHTPPDDKGGFACIVFLACLF